MSESKALINEELRDGPVTQRKCTDFLFCLMFLCFTLSLIAVGAVGFMKGDPTLLLYPYDSSGNQCGRPSTALSSYNYLYYPLASQDSDFSQYRVCMSSCPSSSTSTLSCYSTPEIKCSSSHFYIIKRDEYILPYNSSSLFKRFCIPNSDSLYFSSVVNDAYDLGVKGWVSDIFRCWSALLVVLAIACVASIVYLIMLRYCAGVVVWVSIVFTAVIIVMFGVYLDKVADENFSEESKKKTRNALRSTAIVVYVCVLLYFLAVLFLYRRINLAIAVMKSAAIFIKDVALVFFVPLSMFVVSAAVFAYWVLALIFIYSSGEIDKSNTAIARINWDETTRNSFYFEAIGILWVNAFKVALTQIIVACTVCFWYFSRESSSGSIVYKSTYYAMRYHLGTLAFGSLVLSIVKLLKHLLWYLKTNIYKQSGGNNTLSNFCCTCLSCYAECFTRFLEFIDKNAYIQTAMQGLSFIDASKAAFNLILENAARFATLGAIGDIFKILGKVFITCISTNSGFLIISSYEPYKSTVENPIAPIMIFAITSYIVSGIFMTVHEMACDTIIQAYLIDEVIHKDAFFAPEPLKDFINKHREIEHTSHCCGCL